MERLIWIWLGPREDIRAYLTPGVICCEGGNVRVWVEKKNQGGRWCWSLCRNFCGGLVPEWPSLSKEHKVVEAVKDGSFYGLVRCDVRVPPELMEHFSEMTLCLVMQNLRRRTYPLICNSWWSPPVRFCPHKSPLQVLENTEPRTVCGLSAYYFFSVLKCIYQK